MNGYANVLKARREQHHLTVRQLAERIERSTTFVTDFELKKKANPPEPEMMRRLAQALNWSVDEQLREWGYELEKEQTNRGNPFPPSDPRWQLIVKLQRIDIKDPGADFVVKALHQLLDLYLTEEELFIGPMGNASNRVDYIENLMDDEATK